MLVDVSAHHLAYGNYAKPGVLCRLQRLADEDRRQSPSLKFGGDLRVDENALTVTVGVFEESDGPARDADRELLVLLGHGRLGAGLVGGHHSSILPGGGRGLSRVVGRGGAGSRGGVPT